MRDQKSAFFVSALDPGEWVLRYEVLAQTPGVFRVLPAVAEEMYAPEVRGRTGSKTIAIHEQQSTN